MRTFSASTFHEARAAWDSGEFGPEWRDIRHKAAMAGIIYPPAGTRWDGWDEDSPSQRAIVYRALVETPRLLEKCLRGSRSWSDVIAKLTRARDDIRADQRALDVSQPADEQPDHREAAMTLKQILERIGDS